MILEVQFYQSTCGNCTFKCGISHQFLNICFCILLGVHILTFQWELVSQPSLRKTDKERLGRKCCKEQPHISSFTHKLPHNSCTALCLTPPLCSSHKNSCCDTPPLLLYTRTLPIWKCPQKTNECSGWITYASLVGNRLRNTTELTRHFHLCSQYWLKYSIAFHCSVCSLYF